MPQLTEAKTIGYAFDADGLDALFGSRVDEVMRIVAMLGADELLAHATGSRVFTNMSDLRLFRTYRLYEALTDPQSSAPVSEAEAVTLLASFFKITPSSARRQLALATARYAHDLRKLRTSRVQRALTDATPVGTTAMSVFLPTGWIRDEVMAAADGFDKVGRAKEVTDDPRRLLVPNDLFAYLSVRYGVTTPVAPRSAAPTGKRR